MISGFRSANEDGYVVVLSNNKDINGDKNYRYASMKENIGITKIDVYKENYNIEITNYFSGNKTAEVLLKLDNKTIDIITVDIKSNETFVLSGKLNELGQILSAKVNTKDDIAIDNYTSRTIERENETSVFLSKSSSTYVRDALILNRRLVISESVDSEILNDGFDIYL
ncbi:MAG: hypothetical protein WBA54_02200 [Acidaminobacteraceae bacterium]